MGACKRTGCTGRCTSEILEVPLISSPRKHSTTTAAFLCTHLVHIVYKLPGVPRPQREVVGCAKPGRRHGIYRHRRHEACGGTSALPQREQRALQPHGRMDGYRLPRRQDQALQRPRRSTRPTGEADTKRQQAVLLCRTLCRIQRPFIPCWLT